jgi:exosome complex component RRP42
VVSIASNIFFDPTREELAVADTVLAVSVTSDYSAQAIELLSVRTISPPAHLTSPGVPDAVNPATNHTTSVLQSTTAETPGVWKAPQGGMPRALLARVLESCLQPGGVATEVLEALDGVDVG